MRLRTLLTSLALMASLGACSRTSLEQPTADVNPTAAAVYQEDFNGVALGKYKDDDLEVIDCGGARQRCLQASYRPNAKGSPRLGFREKLPAAREYTLSYDVRFDSNFEWVRGGKLPGLTAANSISGCNATEADGWSARLMWRTEASLVQYLYHQDKDNECGEDVPAEGFTFERNRWYRLSLYVKVNSAASAEDGQVLLFVDGKEVARRDKLRLRSVSGTKGLIELFYFSSFYGGNDPSWAPSKTTYATFDNFSVQPGLLLSSPPTGPRESAYDKTEGENFTAESGIRVVSSTKASGGKATGYAENGDWIKYTLNFGASEAEQVKFRYSSGRQVDTALKLEFRLDSPTGKLIAAPEIQSTDDWQQYKEVSHTLASAPEGQQEVYVVFRSPVSYGVANLDWLQFTK